MTDLIDTIEKCMWKLSYEKAVKGEGTTFKAEIIKRK